MTNGDIEYLDKIIIDGIAKNLSILNSRIIEGSILKRFIQELEESLNELGQINFSEIINSRFVDLRKIHVHGDMSTAQALLVKNNISTLDMLLDSINKLDKNSIDDLCNKLEYDIKWIDFEGEPAKNKVSKNYDPRQSVFKDLAGVIQGFWYMLNFNLFSKLKLNLSSEISTKEKVRKISLGLSGFEMVNDYKIDGLTQELVDFARLCFKRIKKSLIKGYFDEIEKLGKQDIIMKKWDREKAIEIVDYWILLRAVHEFGYECYARDNGTEMIPGGVILMTIRKIIDSSKKKF
jgi:hypothetical protein